MLIGREAELRFLEHYYTNENSQILIVYGQKGVGKTTLLKHFAKNKPCSYYLARSCSAREQRYQWANELAQKKIAIKKYPEYGEIFEQIFTDTSSHKPVLIIDEFHHMIKADESFMEQLVQYVKAHPVMILLCTSASGWVENSMIPKIGSLTASLSGLLKVRELKFSDMCQLFPGFSLTDSIQIFAALGGITGLWNCFSQKLTAKENIISNLLFQDSRLYNEMSMYMAEELREPAVYNTILAAMAKGLNKLNDIYAHTGFSRAKISVYLKNLMELDLVEKIFSYESKGYSNTQKGIYRIANPYVRFYFRFLFPNQSMLQEMKSEEFYDRVVADYYPEFVEETYRKICKEKLSESYSLIGEWIGKTGAIDIVAEDADKKVLAAVCSYARKITYADYEWLLFQLKQAKLKPDCICMFCEAGFDEQIIQKAAEGELVLRQLIADSDTRGRNT